MALFNATVLVGALGYFVDIYDLVLFSILRVASLRSLGVPEEKLLETGVQLLNCQMGGLLIGGLLWGVLGDKLGRVSVLFGSILLYSTANVLNAFAASVPVYAALRFIAGVGLAGELGAAITLVSEVLPKEVRGYGTAIVAGVGLSGAVVAGLVGDLFSWRVAYLTGGALGFLLLLLRMRMLESGVYREMAARQDVARGSLRLLFLSPRRLVKYLGCILIGVPVWYVVGLLVTFSPEITKALEAREAVEAGKGILFTYVGVSIGDIVSGVLSQYLGSRRKMVTLSLLLVAALVIALFCSRGFSAFYFYAWCVLVGLATGYWAVFVTIAAEQFGTNLRATVTTSSPNFVRGSVVALTSSFHFLRGPLGIMGSAATVGAVTLALAFVSLWSLEETFGKDLNFLEQ